MKPARVSTQNPELADRFDRVLGATVEALEESDIHYAFIGGVASGGLGRPRSTHDIDIFVKPEEAELALRALVRKGFRVEKTDPSWLYKAYLDNILVDVIFKSKGDIYLDAEMSSHMVTAEFHGKLLKFVSPEDLIIIKALAHSEATPGHWHDALALLSHATLDWDYLIRRARRAPRRILSLLIYAHSSDIWVPKHGIDQLYESIFGDARPAASPRNHAAGRPHLQVITPQRSKPHAANHAIARLREALAEDPRTNELDIQIEQEGKRFLLRGEVMTEARRDAVSQIVRENFPGFEIENQLRISSFSEPSETEEIK